VHGASADLLMCTLATHTDLKIIALLKDVFENTNTAVVHKTKPFQVIQTFDK